MSKGANNLEGLGEIHWTKEIIYLDATLQDSLLHQDKFEMIFNPLHYLCLIHNHIRCRQVHLLEHTYSNSLQLKTG